MCFCVRVCVYNVLLTPQATGGFFGKTILVVKQDNFVFHGLVEVPVEIPP